MSPEVFAALFEGGITVILGAFCTLLGYRVLGQKPGESVSYDAWHATNGRMFRVGGPIIMVGGVFLGLRTLLSGS